MNIVAMLLIGLFVGAVAKLLMPGRDPGGIIITCLLGIAGSFVAGWVGYALGYYRRGVDGPGVIASIVGAMFILFIYRITVKRRANLPFV